MLKVLSETKMGSRVPCSGCFWARRTLVGGKAKGHLPKEEFLLSKRMMPYDGLQGSKRERAVLLIARVFGFCFCVTRRVSYDGFNDWKSSRLMRLTSGGECMYKYINMHGEDGWMDGHAGTFLFC